MSWRFYETLTTQPDFSVDPTVGLGNMGRTLIDMGEADAFAYWHGDTAKAFGFTYRIQSPAQLRNFREAMNRIGGKATNFFTPSWTPDFTLAAAASSGATSISVVGDFFSGLTDNRPDTPGRTIFVVTAGGQFQAFGVLSAAIDGDNETVQLDNPLTFDIDPTAVIVGRLHLVRLTMDSIEYLADAPGQTSVELRMTTARIRRMVNAESALEGADQFALKAFTLVAATDADPLLSFFDEPFSKGPTAYGASPVKNYFTNWDGYFEGGDFKIESEHGEIEVTSYGESYQAEHIDFAFGPSARSILAYATPQKTVKIDWTPSGGPDVLEFDGLSPVVFNTYEIDATKSAATADAVVFYLRKGFSGIFARFYREDFATEHLILRSPTAPIYLQLAQANGSTLEIVGMDAGHRLAKWQSPGYFPPLDAEVPRITVDPITGSYDLVRILAEVPDEIPTISIDEVRGDYVSIRVEGAASDGLGTSIDGRVGGSYDDVRIEAAATDPLTVSIEGGIAGDYEQKAKPGSASTSGSTSIKSVGGSYS